MEFGPKDQKNTTLRCWILMNRWISIVAYENRFIDGFRQLTPRRSGLLQWLALQLISLPRHPWSPSKPTITGWNTQNRKPLSTEGCSFFSNSVGIRFYFEWIFRCKMSNNDLSPMHRCIADVASVNLWDVRSGGAFCCSEGLMDAPPEKYLSWHDL